MAGPTGLKPALTSVTRKDTVNYATVPNSFRSLPDATRKSLWVALEFNTVCPTTSDQPSTGNTRPRFVFKLPDGTLGSSPTSELTSRFLAAGSVVSGPERRSVATGRQLLGPAACSETSWWHRQGACSAIEARIPAFPQSQKLVAWLEIESSDFQVMSLTSRRCSILASN